MVDQIQDSDSKVNGLVSSHHVVSHVHPHCLEDLTQAERGQDESSYCDS